MSAPDWDNYIPKHYARYYGWLPAAKEFRQGINKSTLKYFTLCDVQAIDIFMLEKEGILARDGNGRLPNVVICEEDFDKIPEILKVVRPPIHEAIVHAKLEDVLTFEDDEFTLFTPLNSWVRDKRKRHRLQTKRKYERLRLFFPFDIINFDPCNSLLDPGIGENKIHHALEKVFELQKTTGEFLLFVTTPLTTIHPSTEQTFKADFDNNISMHTEIKDMLEASWGTAVYDEAEELKRAALSIAKSLVLPAAQRSGWNCSHKGIYVYENQAGHKMLNSVLLCMQSRGGVDDALYLDDVLRIINSMPEYYPFTLTSAGGDVKKHLDSIKAFRDELQAAD